MKPLVNFRASLPNILMMIFVTEKSVNSVDYGITLMYARVELEQHEDIDTLKICAQECTINEACTFFEYYGDQRICRLFSRESYTGFSNDLCNDRVTYVFKRAEFGKS